MTGYVVRRGTRLISSVVELELRVGLMQCYGVGGYDGVRVVWEQEQGNVKGYLT